MPPTRFLPVAEDAGLIVDIGRWVLEQAAQAIAGWRRTWPELRVGVNMSAPEIADRGLVAHLRELMERTGIDPAALVVEITESSLIDDTQASARWLDAIRRTGVGMVLDDFGTGYSSLAYIQRLPLDAIKVDRSFVARLGSSREGAAIISAISALATALELDVVAEGIETEEQLRRVRELGCGFGQGNLLGEPLLAGDVPAGARGEPTAPARSGRLAGRVVGAARGRPEPSRTRRAGRPGGRGPSRRGRDRRRTPARCRARSPPGARTPSRDRRGRRSRAARCGTRRTRRRRSRTRA